MQLDGQSGSSVTTLNRKWREARTKQLSPEGLLEWWGNATLPIPVVHLARWLGLAVKMKNLDFEGSKCWGALNLRLPQPTIFVSPESPPARQRFTVAHELGHLCLHFDQHIFRELSGSDLRESEADEFAGKLLVPTKYLKQDIYQIGLDRLMDSLDLLSAKYFVSRKVLEIRLTDVLNERH